MGDQTATLVFLVGRIERLQRDINKHYCEVDKATREIALINSLLQQLRSTDAPAEVSSNYLSERPPTPYPG